MIRALERRQARNFLAACAVALAIGAAIPSADADGDHHAPRANAIGTPGDAAKASRTIDVEMSDRMRFTPANFTVRKGETVRFIVRNVGRLRHEMVLGTASALREHAAQMSKAGPMRHEAANELTVEPGKAGDLVWHFSRAGTVDFACLEPGHFEAGMRGTVTVR